MSFLSLAGVAKAYGPVAALSGIDLAVERGGRTVVVGASGSGKTTLLRLIAGFERPDRGSISLDGVVLADDRTTVPVHRRGIAFVPQDGALFPHLSVAENIAFGMEAAGADREKAIAELMAMVDLAPQTRSRAPHELSGGQQQRVAIARGLARKPKLMLLDEPFSALDAGLRESVRQATARVLAAAGVTTILVTHDQSEALSFADTLVVLMHGRVAQAGPPRELYLRPRDAETALFLGDAIVTPAVARDGIVECALGRLPIDAKGVTGPVEVMLRPEQLRLGVGGAGVPVTGRMLEVTFAGAGSLVTVALPGGGGAEIVATLRVPGDDAPAVGAILPITIVGKAHVFPAPGSPDDAGPAHL